MIKLVLHAIGYACLAFSAIGFSEVLLGLITTKTYNLLRAIVYSVLLGIGLVLI
jgi:hypothetical protein